MKDIEYLSKELLDFDYTITDDKICIESDNTIIVNVTRLEKIDKKEITELRKNIIEIAKKNDVSISYKYKTKSFIDNSYKAYEVAFNHYNRLFDIMIEGYQTVKERGLHSGLIYDKVKDLVSLIKNEYIKKRHHDNIVYQMEHLHFNLKRMYEELEYNAKNMCKIYL